jgi:hypothetical protein
MTETVAVVFLIALVVIVGMVLRVPVRAKADLKGFDISTDHNQEPTAKPKRKK